MSTQRPPRVRVRLGDGRLVTFAPPLCVRCGSTFAPEHTCHAASSDYSWECPTCGQLAEIGHECPPPSGLVDDPDAPRAVPERSYHFDAPRVVLERPFHFDRDSIDDTWPECAYRTDPDVVATLGALIGITIATLAAAATLGALVAARRVIAHRLNRGSES